jgi:hypothetical protein
MANINPILAAAAKSNTALQSGMATVQADTAAQADLYTTIGQTYESIGKNNALIESVKLTGALQTQDSADLIAYSLGTDVTQSTNKLLGLNDRLQAGLATRDAALAVVNEKNRVGLFEDPLTWVLNQLTVNDDIAKYNAANAEVHGTTESIRVLTAATDAQVATTKALQHSVNAASIEAASANMANIANVHAMQAKTEGYKSNSAGVESAMRMTKDQLANAYTVYNAQQSAAAEGRANEQLAMQREQQKYQREVWEASTNEKNMKKLALDEQLRVINIGRVNRGAPVLEGSGAARFLTLRGTDGSIAAEFQDDYKRGSMTLVQNRKVVSVDPASLLETLNTSGIALTPAQAPIKTAMDAVKKQLAYDIQLANTATGPLKGAKLTNELVANHANTLTREIFSAYSNKIVAADPDNPYNIPAISDIIKYPSMQNLPLVTKVLAPLLTTPEGAKSLEDQKKLAAIVVSALESQKISYAEAVELPALYQVGNAVNNEAKQFKSLGLPENNSYNAPVRYADDSTATLDLTNYGQWSRYLGKELAFRAFKDQRFTR